MGSGRGPVAREPGEAAQPTQATCHRWPQPRATECAAPCPALHAKTWAACRQVTDGGQKCGQMHPAQAGAITSVVRLAQSVAGACAPCALTDKSSPVCRCDGECPVVMGSKMNDGHSNVRFRHIGGRQSRISNPALPVNLPSAESVPRRKPGSPPATINSRSVIHGVAHVLRLGVPSRELPHRS